MLKAALTVLVAVAAAPTFAAGNPLDICEEYGSYCDNAAPTFDIVGVCTQSQCGHWDEESDSYVVWECGRCIPEP